MYPEITSRRNATTRDAIDAFVKERGIELPESYVSFLLATNGGTPRHDTFPVKERPYDPFSHVQNFLGIGVSIPTSELSYAYDLYASGFPHGIVPIANESLGRYTCLDLRGGKARVVFWDHRHFWSTGEWREEDLFEVADTFEEFLTLLRPSPY